MVVNLSTFSKTKADAEYIKVVPGCNLFLIFFCLVTIPHPNRPEKRKNAGILRDSGV